MNTLQHYSALITIVSTMQTKLNALGYDFKEIAPITPIDEQLIDALVATATVMLSEATALKAIVYDPTPLEEPTP